MTGYLEAAFQAQFTSPHTSADYRARFGKCLVISLSRFPDRQESVPEYIYIYIHVFMTPQRMADDHAAAEFYRPPRLLTTVSLLRWLISSLASLLQWAF